MFDIVLIGGGVIGGAILRELTKYHLRVCLLEKEEDVAMGQSKANSGIVHAGFDAKCGTLKAKFNVLGNAMMEEYALSLGVKFIRNGSLVVAFSREEMDVLIELKERGDNNGVPNLKILTREQLINLEPNISDDALGALYAPSGGIVCPYKLTIASIGNAMDNGAKLYLGFKVVKIEKEKEFFNVYSQKGKKVSGKVIINCAGIYSQEIANMAGDFSFTIGGRKGEYILLDRESGGFVKNTLFFTPTAKGKGILVSPTVHGNILLGPTAEVVTDKNVETSVEGLKEVQEKASKMCKKVPFDKTITSFAGTRAFCDRNDFIIEESRSVKALINVSGIESPGLTSAPAIAKYVVEELITKHFTLKTNKQFNGVRKPDDFFSSLSLKEKNELINKEPSYGRMVCRCEKITEGEILYAIRTNPKASSVDAVKRRTRAGMGRCQGGFCQIMVAELIAKEQNLNLDKVTKSGGKSYLIKGKTK